MAISIGTYITNLRTEKGLSMRELATKANISVAEISRVESGKRLKPAPASLKAIAAALNADYSDLMKVAGYVEDETDDEGIYEKVFRDENGEIVDVVRGVKEMLRRDETWANAAYRVSRELSPEDRKILTEMAMSFLKNKKGQ